MSLQCNPVLSDLFISPDTCFSDSNIMPYFTYNEKQAWELELTEKNGSSVYLLASTIACSLHSLTYMVNINKDGTKECQDALWEIESWLSHKQPYSQEPMAQTIGNVLSKLSILSEAPQEWYQQAQMDQTDHDTVKCSAGLLSKLLRRMTGEATEKPEVTECVPSSPLSKPFTDM